MRGYVRALDESTGKFSTVSVYKPQGVVSARFFAAAFSGNALYALVGYTNSREKSLLQIVLSNDFGRTWSSVDEISPTEGEVFRPNPQLAINTEGIFFVGRVENLSDKTSKWFTYRYDLTSKKGAVVDQPNFDQQIFSAANWVEVSDGRVCVSGRTNNADNVGTLWIRCSADGIKWSEFTKVALKGPIGALVGLVFGPGGDLYLGGTEKGQGGEWQWKIFKISDAGKKVELIDSYIGVEGVGAYFDGLVQDQSGYIYATGGYISAAYGQVPAIRRMSF